MKQFKIVVEKHPDTYLAYPLGLKGVVVGQGDTYESALADVKSAIRIFLNADIGNVTQAMMRRHGCCPILHTAV